MFIGKVTTLHMSRCCTSFQVNICLALTEVKAFKERPSVEVTSLGVDARTFPSGEKYLDRNIYTALHELFTCTKRKKRRGDTIYFDLGDGNLPTGRTSGNGQ